MSQKHWNFITLIAVAAIAVGFFFAKSGISWGKILLALGCVAFVICIIAASILQKKHPPCCPVCGEPLVFVGRRFGGGIWGVDTLDHTICLNCGAVVSSKDL